MKKVLFVLCIILMFSAVACNPKTSNEVTGLVTLEEYGDDKKTEEVKTETVEPEANKEVVEKIIEQEQVSETAGFKEGFKQAIEDVKNEAVGPAIRNVLAKTKDIKSYSFLYGGPETAGCFKDTFYCLGAECSKMIIKFYEGNEYVREGYYDHVYISGSDMFGCCEKPVRCESHNVDNTKKLFEVKTDSLFIPKTPLQWLQTFSGMNAEFIGKSTFDERTVEDFVFSDGTYTFRVKIDEHFGLPHLIEQFEGENKVAKFQFNDLIFNNWKDSFFEPPCRQAQ